MPTKFVNETLICTGDKICTTIESVMNKSLTAVPGVSVEILPPKGVSYIDYNLTQGVFNPLTNIWTIGAMLKGQNATGNICWRVDDDCLAPFKFNLILKADSDHVCLNGEEKEFCIVVDGLTKCQFDTFKSIKTIDGTLGPEATLSLTDYTVLVDASTTGITINVPEPADTYFVNSENSNKNGGKEYHIKVIDLTNPVKIQTPSGKIVDFSTIDAAGSDYDFSLVGQTVLLHSDGENYFVKTI